ncbi:hypothetical protein ACFQ2J_08295 [Thalassobacillus hwangdonensis]|uniref:Uncharacterized protein n=1 Tax=Thalassobacillus hwangdonensis TaxID=546108 RepID=A0ABW3L1D5_9BACI
MQKILQFIVVGAAVGFLISIFVREVNMVYTILLTVIATFLTLMYAELYHIREAINRQRSEQKEYLK